MPTLAALLESGLAPAGRVGVRGAVDDDERAGGHPARHPRRRAGLLLVREEGPAAAVVGRPARPVRASSGRSRTGRGCSRDDGVSISNLFSGDAERTIMTVGTLLDDDGHVRADPHDFFGYLLNPYNLYRGIVGMLGEAVVEVYQAIRQWARDEQPRIRRLGLFTLHRGAANVILRDATTWSVIASMYRGHRMIYCDYQGYDEVGHFAGPETTRRGRDAQQHRPPDPADRAGGPRGAPAVPARRALGSRPDDVAGLPAGLRQAARRDRARGDQGRADRALLGWQGRGDAVRRRAS